MTDQHPLTDEVIEEIARSLDPDEDDMRAATDWQLEQEYRISMAANIRAELRKLESQETRND